MAEGIGGGRDPIARNNVSISGKLDASRTILLSHGFGSNQLVWSVLTPFFADEFRIVSFDHAGSGGSDPVAFQQGDYLNLGRYADDLLEICERLDLSGAYAIGHSKGAMICALAAIERPDRFRRLALIGASPRYLDDETYHGGFTPSDVDGIYKAVMQNFDGFVQSFADSFVGVRDSVFRRSFVESLQSLAPETALTILCAVLQSDHRADLDRLKTPTLLIQPRHDRAVPMDVAEFMHARIAGSRLVVVDNDGHFPHVTAVPAVAAAIRAWFHLDRPARRPRQGVIRRA